jgi:hypothetical protein
MMLTPLLGVGLFAQTFGLTAAAMMRILEHNAVRADVPRRSQAPERTIRGLTFWAGTISVDAVYFSVKAKVGSMTDEPLAAMHRLLAEYHRKLAKEAVLMSANNKTRKTVMSKNDMPALRRVIAPAQLERAKASLRGLWRNRSAGVNDQFFLGQKLERPVPFQINRVSKIAVIC